MGVRCDSSGVVTSDGVSKQIVIDRADTVVSVDGLTLESYRYDANGHRIQVNAGGPSSPRAEPAPRKHSIPAWTRGADSAVRIAKTANLIDD